MCSQELRGKAALINTYSRREHAGSQVGRSCTVVMAVKSQVIPQRVPELLKCTNVPGVSCKIADHVV